MFENILRGIDKKTLTELKKRKFSKADITPASPVPILEEAIGAVICVLGGYKCFPWRGEIFTFSERNFVKITVNGKIPKKSKKIEINIEKIQEEEGLCQKECKYNHSGTCKYDPLDLGKTGCEDPFLEIQRLTATDFTDLL